MAKDRPVPSDETLSATSVAKPLARIIQDAPVFGRIQPAGGGLGFTRH